MCLLVYEYVEVDEAENNVKLHVSPPLGEHNLSFLMRGMLVFVLSGKICTRRMCGVLSMECTVFLSKLDHLSESRS